MRASILLIPVLIVTGCAPQGCRPGAPEEKPAAPNAEPVRPVGPRVGPFDTTVTVRYWSAPTGTFQTIEGIPAARQNAKSPDGTEQVRWLLQPVGATGEPTPGSEIIDADGTVWVVHRMERVTTAYTTCYVNKRAGGGPPVGHPRSIPPPERSDRVGP